MSTLTSPATSKPIKRKRFRGWVCEDEVSEGETALLEKLESQGREYAAAPWNSKINTNTPHAASATRRSASHPDGPKNIEPRPRKTRVSKSSTSNPPIPSPTSDSNHAKGGHKRGKQTGIALEPKKLRSTPHKPPSQTYREVNGSITKVTAASSGKYYQQPKKKPRFRGYICEDEVEDENPALADAIRRKGTLFEMKETTKANLILTKAATKSLNNLNDGSNFVQMDPYRGRKYDAAAAAKSGISTPESKISHGLALNTEPPKQKPKPKSNSMKARSQPVATKPDLLFPNLSSNRDSTTSATASNTAVTPRQIVENPSGLARARQLVRDYTQDLKNLTAIADKAARAAEEAKRRADDAANKLQEVKRLYRTESEKEKARLEGRKYVSGWAWVENVTGEKGEINRQGKGGGFWRRAVDGNASIVEQGRGKAVDLEKKEKKQTKEIYKDDDEVEEDDDEGEDEEGDEELDDDEEDEDGDSNMSNDSEGSDSESEGGYTQGRTADLLG